MDWGIIATIGIFIVGVVGSVLAWLINRSVGHIDQRSERMERKHDAFVEKMDLKFDAVHGRITTTEKDIARLWGGMDGGRPDSKTLPKYPR